MLKVAIVQNFATIGIPDFDEELGKNWSIVALSDQLIDESRLNGLQHLNTRRLDLVIHNGTKFALLNLQAFKIFECPLATSTVQQCLTHNISADGNLLFGIQPSGDIIILSEGLQKLKCIKKPSLIQLQSKSSRWNDSFPMRLLEYFSGTRNKSQVSPVQQPPKTSSWFPLLVTTPSSTSQTPNGNYRSPFPYITALPNGLALFCAFSPINYYVFVSTYETALRTKSIANLRGSQVPGKWHRIIMHKIFIVQWLEDKKCIPWFEAKLCYCNSDESGENDTVGGAMMYAVATGLGIEVVYGFIRRRGEKFTLAWEKVEYVVDLPPREPSTQHNLGLRFVTRLSSDCSKIAVVISTNLGIYSCIQEFPVFSDSPIHIERQPCCLCAHSDFDGTHFYKSQCWVSDIQWLVEDAYIACMTLCGSLSIFYANSGESMVLKVRKPGAEADESKSARYFLPIFHPHQIRPTESPPDNPGRSGWNGQSCYPTIKWIDSEKILTCSNGMKIELFSIQRVLHLLTNEMEGSTSELKELNQGAGAPPQVKDTLNQNALSAFRQHDNPMWEEVKLSPSETYFPPRITEGDRIKTCLEEKVSSYSLPFPDNLELKIRPVSIYSTGSNMRQTPVSPGVMADSRLVTTDTNKTYPDEEDFEEDYNRNVFSASVVYKGDGTSSSSVNVEGGELDLDEEEGEASRPKLPAFQALPEKEHSRDNLNELPGQESSSDLIPEIRFEGEGPRCETPDSQPCCRKPSQLYMADDELSDTWSRDRYVSSKRRPSSRIRYSAGSNYQPGTASSSPHSRPPSSRQYDTEQTSYSPPFSYAPTTAGDDYEHEYERPTTDSRPPALSPGIKADLAIPTPITPITSVPSSTRNDTPITSNNLMQVRLQMPPVPAISAVVITTATVSTPSSPREWLTTEGTQVDEEFYMQPVQGPEFRYQVAPFSGREGAVAETKVLEQNRNSLRNSPRKD